MVFIYSTNYLTQHVNSVLTCTTLNCLLTCLLSAALRPWIDYWTMFTTFYLEPQLPSCNEPQLVPRLCFCLLNWQLAARLLAASSGALDFAPVFQFGIWLPSCY